MHVTVCMCVCVAHHLLGPHRVISFTPNQSLLSLPVTHSGTHMPTHTHTHKNAYTHTHTHRHPYKLHTHGHTHLELNIHKKILLVLRILFQAKLHRMSFTRSSTILLSCVLSTPYSTQIDAYTHVHTFIHTYTHTHAHRENLMHENSLTHKHQHI